MIYKIVINPNNEITKGAGTLYLTTKDKDFIMNTDNLTKENIFQDIDFNR